MLFSYSFRSNYPCLQEGHQHLRWTEGKWVVFHPQHSWLGRITTSSPAGKMLKWPKLSKTQIYSECAGFPRLSMFFVKPWFSAGIYRIYSRWSLVLRLFTIWNRYSTLGYSIYIDITHYYSLLQNRLIILRSSYVWRPSARVHRRLAWRWREVWWRPATWCSWTTYWVRWTCMWPRRWCRMHCWGRWRRAPGCLGGAVEFVTYKVVPPQW